MHKDVPGETLKKEYVAFCRVNRWVDDSLDLSSDFRSQLLPFTIGDPNEITKEALVQDILSNLSLGDSISAYQEMDSLSLIKYKTSKSKRFIMNLKVDSIGEPGSSAAYFEYLQNTQNPLFIERAKIGELSKETLKAQIDLYKNQSKQGYVEIDSSIQMKSISKFNNEKLGYHNWIIFDVVSIFEDGSSFMNSYNSVSSNYINNANYSTIGGIHTALANMSEGEEAVFIFLLEWLINKMEVEWSRRTLIYFFTLRCIKLYQISWEYIKRNMESINQIQLYITIVICS